MSQWHVLGAGAIGSLFACRLQDAGMQVTLLSHRDPSPLRQLTLATEPVHTYQLPQQLVSAGRGEDSRHQPLAGMHQSMGGARRAAAIAPRLNRDSTVVLSATAWGSQS